MNKKWAPLLFAAVVLLAGPISGAGAQSPSEDSPRVLLIGDSWASLMWEYKSYQQVFDEYGFADVQLDGRLVGAGGTARTWAEVQTLAALSAHLTQNPSLDTVIISLGGNDVLGSWRTATNQGREDQLLEEVWRDLLSIIETILAVRPDIEVLLMGYDYTNFFETQEQDETGRTARAWEELGRPVPADVNYLTIRLEEQKLELARTDDRVFYVQSFGLMQFVFGYPNPPDFMGAGFEPFSVPFPGQADTDFDPFPGGDPNYPSPPSAMANGGGDPIHLNQLAYHAIASLQMETYFHDRLRGEPAMELTAASDGFSGWVRSDGGVDADDLFVGAEDQSTNYAAILSFDTAPIHNRAEITRASIYLVREGDCCGQNPISGNGAAPARLDLSSGGFGALTLEASDHATPAEWTDIGAFHGSLREGGHTLRIDLDPQVLAAIDKRGWTQVRISIPEYTGNDGVVRFHLSGESAPRMDVYYETPPFSLLDLIDPDVQVGGIPIATIIVLSVLCLLGVLVILGASSILRRRRAVR